MLKEMLRRILGRKGLDYEELETILCDCEATINSRPLTYIEDNSEGVKPSIPACFLQSIPSSETTGLDEIDSKSLNIRLRFVQKLRQDLRMRFRNEYLAMLFHKGKSREESLRVGEVILLETDGKRINWPLGIVIEVFSGVDGHSRVARVGTADGEKLRPCQRLYSLKINNSEKLPFVAQDTRRDESASTNMTLRPAANDSDSSEDGDSSPKVEDFVTRAGRRVKIPNRLHL
ncbi:uncharacterized protein LOC118196552 [Stegodyphus dumicola]|uniref:uncharacterized protein LOC118196552 n=1 Tax=Stegodyphus dumicola TaxID=202533 RepID=UPI0015B06ECA|nr:uncharacterized protein LOC118196552 [Stegodyphus dumicola]